MDPDTVARGVASLVEDGFVVLPLPADCSEAASACVTLFDGARPFPEKLGPGLSRYLVGGGAPAVEPGFGGCPLPSSMHCPESRRLHRLLQDQVYRPLAAGLVRSPRPLAFLGEGRPKFFAYMYDRWCQRSAGIKPAAEALHRDLSPDSFSGARNMLVFGGFVAAEGAQVFTCYRGTHVVGRSRPDAGEGFSKLSKSECGELSARLSHERRQVQVPEGSVLVFFENILHEVRARPYPHRITRLFTAFAVWSGAPPCAAPVCGSPDGRGRDCFMCTQVSFCREGALTHLKSKQLNRTYPALYACNHRGKLAIIAGQLPAIAPPGGFSADCPRGSALPLAVHPAVELALPYSEEELSVLSGVPVGI